MKILLLTLLSYGFDADNYSAREILTDHFTYINNIFDFRREIKIIKKNTENPEILLRLSNVNDNYYVLPYCPEYYDFVFYGNYNIEDQNKLTDLGESTDTNYHSLNNEIFGWMFTEYLLSKYSRYLVIENITEIKRIKKERHRQ